MYDLISLKRHLNSKGDLFHSSTRQDPLSKFIQTIITFNST